MKSLTTAMQLHLAGEVTTLATCWKLTRRDGAVMGFTDHDQSITVGEVTYQAESGFTPSAVHSSSALNVDNLDVEGMLDNAAISEADVLAGRYDYAEISIFRVNYRDVLMGALPLKTGWLGEVTLRNGRFIAEVRGLTQRLGQTVGAHYSPTCRARLGDAACGVDTDELEVSGALTDVTSRTQCRDSARDEAAGLFDYGVMTFTSGANAGLSMEVKRYTAGAFILTLPMPYAMAVGDAYTVVPGCNKSFGTCQTKFNNALNFRGEPHVPGLDAIMKTSGTR